MEILAISMPRRHPFTAQQILGLRLCVASTLSLKARLGQSLLKKGQSCLSSFS